MGTEGKAMKFDFRKHKKAIAIITVIALITVGGGAVFLRSRGGGEPVNVYPFQYLGMTEYWGDAQESYGPVTGDNIQTVFLSDTQTVTSIKVSEGDTVKKGDLLMTYDTTLSDIAVERKRLVVERLKLQQQNARIRLKEINAMVPMATPAPTVTPDAPNYGPILADPFTISMDTAYDGSSPELAMICHLRDDTDIDNSLLAALYDTAVKYQTSNLSKLPESEEPLLPAVSPVPSEIPAPQETPVPMETPVVSEAPVITDTPDPTPKPMAEVTDFYAVFKVTEGNAQLAPQLLWQGMHIYVTEDGGFTFKFYDGSALPDHMLPPPEEEEPTEPPKDSGFTAAEIAQMRAEQQRTINDLALEIKMAETEYQLTKLEADNGSVYAEIDGEVVSLLTEEQARMEGQPLMKVSGGGGFYVDGSISELEIHNMQIGQEVEVNDWITGMTYVGTIESIGNFPDTENGWNGMGNPNASYFPFRVYIDGSADLQPGRYVSVMYSASAAQNGIYLENPFLRTEQGTSYVYVMDSDGRLEKRIVTTGKNLWGSYTEIRSGLSPEDLIAFPYGKNVREGAKAVEADISTLYE